MSRLTTGFMALETGEMAHTIRPDMIDGLGELTIPYPGRSRLRGIGRTHQGL